MEKECKCCKDRFVVRDNRQGYCSKLCCQRTRKSRWQKKALAEDAEYRESQADAQKIWRKKNPDYMQDYRKGHPDYVTRNRELQKQRRMHGRLRRPFLPLRGQDVVKMDAACATSVVSGIYELVPVSTTGVVKMDAIRIHLSVLQGVG